METPETDREVATKRPATTIAAMPPDAVDVDAADRRRRCRGFLQLQLWGCSRYRGSLEDNDDIIDEIFKGIVRSRVSQSGLTVLELIAVKLSCNR